MPSRSWQEWNSTRASKLDEIEAAHRSIGGVARGRRYATEQINHAYAMLLASQFQGFCRDLHSECVDFIVRSVSPMVATVAPAVVQSVLRAVFVLGRHLDKGNANPGNIGSDFNRLGVLFWTQVYTDDSDNEERRQLLEDLNTWRNAIAHQDFDPSKLGGTTMLPLSQVRKWRRTCNRLALSFDKIMHTQLVVVTGSAPW
jgi:hypothetical protein